MGHPVENNHQNVQLQKRKMGKSTRALWELPMGQVRELGSATNVMRRFLKFSFFGPYGLIFGPKSPKIDPKSVHTGQQMKISKIAA